MPFVNIIFIFTWAAQINCPLTKVWFRKKNQPVLNIASLLKMGHLHSLKPLQKQKKFLVKKELTNAYQNCSVVQSAAHCSGRNTKIQNKWTTKAQALGMLNWPACSNRNVKLQTQWRHATSEDEWQPDAPYKFHQ